MQIQKKKVLLVCFKNKDNYIVTHDEFYKLFSQFGNVVKILIFERQLIWKTFIQMQTKDQAEKALQNLNGHYIAKEKKLQIVYSKFDSIQFGQNNYAGKQYKKKNCNSKNPYAFSISYRDIHQSSFCMNNMKPLSEIAIQSISQLSNNYTCSLHCLSDQQDEYLFSAFSPISTTQSLSRFGVDDLKVDQKNQNYIQQNEVKFKKNFQQLSKKSKILYTRWFDKDIITVEMLKRVFEVFGYVQKIIFMRRKGSALVQFYCIQHAVTCKQHLNGQNFFNNELKVFSCLQLFYSNNHKQLNPNLKNLRLKKQPMFYISQTEDEEFFINQGNDFNKFDYEYVYPVSQTIIITGLPLSVDKNVLEKLLTKEGNVQRIKFKKQNVNQLCVYVRYESKKKSLMMISYLNGTYFSGNELIIRFAKNKPNTPRKDKKRKS